VGGTRSRTVDMRLVAATNRDLGEAIRQGKFRQDLFYRINTISVTLPPLRDRREDVRVLAEHFLEQNAQYGRKRLAPETLAKLEGYAWPGNVRELQHVIQRAVILSAGETLQLADLPPEIQHGASGAAAPAAGTLEAMEQQHIIATLKQVGGHRGKAATLLGIDPKTLYRKLLSYGISGDSPIP
jgi:two-component system response regulator HydG